MENITFIKDENDYIAYSKQKPQYKYSRLDVQFKCTICNNIAIKKFRNLTKDLICTDCQRKIGRSNPESIAKYKKTCLDRYGVENPSYNNDVKEKRVKTLLTNYGVKNPMESNLIKEKVYNTNKIRYGMQYTQTLEFKEKYKQTCLNKYGVENVSQNPDIQQKKINTCNLHYNCDFPMQSNIVLEKAKNTMLNKYGVTTPLQNNEIFEKFKNTCLDKYGVEYVSQIDGIQDKIHNTRIKNMLLKYQDKLKQLDLQYITNDSKNFKLKCLKCNEEFEFSYSYFYILMHNQMTCFCPNCSRIIHSGYSIEEKEVLSYIKEIYNGPILENDRTVLNGKELDIYLPNLKIAIEYDGTYWHADPRFYTANDIIMHKQAKDIWQNDINKNKMCENLGITLLHIQEYDWLTNKDEVKNDFKVILS